MPSTPEEKLVLSNSTLTYFEYPPGRAEAIRLAFKIGEIPFTDHRITFGEWKSLKPTYKPWHHVPILTLSDGVTVIGQARTILRMVGKCSGLYPSHNNNIVVAAQCDELLDAIDDVHMKAKAVGSHLSDSQKRREARADACSPDGGSIALGLAALDDFIGQHGKNGHAVGDTFTIADLNLFCMTSLWCSGFIDGVPHDVMNNFSHIQECRKLVATHPIVMNHYDSREEKNGGKLHEFETYYKNARNLD
eukprot:CAMPEP_0195293704 /NCGR_PEP_ID=MMETSP0707-20130614/13155_1 /TAXON_ID=33640 /ORGANISM="Asterionellopsis glacialis, Strain CCMP134" /LENGTH=247 /DNA_ID=CAMNT_0040354477 /DNA_START=1 /DNA_END=744 /DNA_ORIENTATION=-